MKIEKTAVKMNKPIYLGYSILEVSKTLMYESRYDYMKSKYGEKTKKYFVNLKLN